MRRLVLNPAWDPGKGWMHAWLGIRVPTLTFHNPFFFRYCHITSCGDSPILSPHASPAVNHTNNNHCTFALHQVFFFALSWSPPDHPFPVQKDCTPILRVPQLVLSRPGDLVEEVNRGICYKLFETKDCTPILWVPLVPSWRLSGGGKLHDVLPVLWDKRICTPILRVPLVLSWRLIARCAISSLRQCFKELYIGLMCELALL